jgi:two-component system nitrogen regulation response regulator NtrX
VVERLLILTSAEVIGKQDVISLLGGSPEELSTPLFAVKSLKQFKEASERLFLLHKLEENRWNVTRTAESIETLRSNLYKKMDLYGIQRETRSESE